MKTKTGYTFVELIISMVILFLAVMVIGSIFPASFKSLLKSKQVTIATTLAQQKLEECLVNPRDYETRVGKEGNFAPDHPEYSYSITEKTVTDKLKELKVEVSKLVNGSKIIDAAVAQLVTRNGFQRFYRLYRGATYFDVTLPDSPVVVPNMSQQIDFPEDGICIVDGALSVCSMNIGVQIHLCPGYDGQIKNDSVATISGVGHYIPLSTRVILPVKQGKHTIALYYLGGSVTWTAHLYAPSMTIQYIPNSAIDVNNCIFQ